MKSLYIIIFYVFSWLTKKKKKYIHMGFNLISYTGTILLYLSVPTKLKATRSHPMILRGSELNSRLLNEIKPCQCHKPSEWALLQPQEEREKITSNTFIYIYIYIFLYKDYQSWFISKIFWIHGKKCLGTIESIQYTIWEKLK